MQPVRPFQVPGPQVQGLILERRVGPDQPDRKDRLNGQHRGQRPPARDRQHADPPLLVRGLRRDRRGGQHGSLRRLRRRNEIPPACRHAVVHGPPVCDQGTCRGRSATPRSPHNVMTASQIVAIVPAQGYRIRKRTVHRPPKEGVCPYPEDTNCPAALLNCVSTPPLGNRKTRVLTSGARSWGRAAKRLRGPPHSVPCVHP